MATRTERYDQILSSLRNTPDVEATALVSPDGLIMASVLPQNLEEDRVGAMSAAMLGLGQRIAMELNRGNLDQVYVKGEKGYILITSVGEEAVLLVITNQNAKLGMVFLDMKRTTEELLKVS